MVADSRVGVVRRGYPALDVALAVDELQVARTLAVAVAGSVLGTRQVGWVLGQAAVGIHGDEIEGSVEAALYVCKNH